MSLPILQTKLYVPRRQRQESVIRRPRLTEKLTAGLASRVTLISAPAGFGKSTLLGEWIAELQWIVDKAPNNALEPVDRPTPGEVRVAWLTLDGDDNDPVRFLLYLIATMQKFGNGIGRATWTLLQSPQPPATNTILTLLLNDLSLLIDEAIQPRPMFVLVLEDYHVIAAQPIHEIVAYLVDHLPSSMHVIFTTRADPPLPLARWRVRDQLSEIRAADLRFLPDEAAAFLNDRMGLYLSEEEVAALETRTEGWIAGLQLAALSLQGHPNKAAFLQTFSGSHRYVLNYLVEEVLVQQTESVQTFLLCTSILDRLCASLCDAVMVVTTPDEGGVAAGADRGHYDSSQAMLDQLQLANLFLAPLDDEGQWYRYHPLFAEVLQHRLRETKPEAWRRLHYQASAWYEEQSLLADAIHHAMRAGDYSRTAELIELSWPAAWDQGAVATLIHWVAALPIEEVVTRSSLAVSYAWALAFADQSEAAEVCLQQVETALQGGMPEPNSAATGRNALLGRIAALRAMMAARRGDAEVAVQLAQAALILMDGAEAPVRGNAWYALGLAYQQAGALPEALRGYQEATQLGVTTRDAFLTITARYHEARIRIAQGQLHIAADIYRQLLAHGPQYEQRPVPVIGLAHVGYAEILYQWNDLITAAQQIESGLALSPSGSLTYTDGPFYRFLTLARIRQALGDPAGALTAYQLAADTALKTGIELDRERAEAIKALVHLRLGRLDVAELWVQAHPAWLLKADRIAYVHEFEMLVFVRILLAQERATEALTVLAGRSADAAAAQRIGSMIEMYILRARAHQLLGQGTEALAAFMQALVLAEPGGYVRVFIDEGEPMRALIADLASTLANARLRRYATKLLVTFDTGPTPLPVTTGKLADFQVHALVDPLTARELDVLHLVTKGLSNAEIAEHLVVTVGTVKTHLKHIYGKLAVQSRTQAIAQARDLGLL